MRLLLSSALVLLILLGPVRAQGTSAPSATFVLPALPSDVAPGAGDIEWTPRVGTQLVSALGSPSVTVRADALHAVVNLALSPQEVDMDPAVPALLHVFRTDPDERLRLLALRSLEATADEKIMTALRREAGRETVREPHPKVQRLLFSILVNHYGAESLRSDPDVRALAGTLRDSARR